MDAVAKMAVTQMIVIDNIVQHRLKGGLDINFHARRLPYCNIIIMESKSSWRRRLDMIDNMVGLSHKVRSNDEDAV